MLKETLCQMFACYALTAFVCNAYTDKHGDGVGEERKRVGSKGKGWGGKEEVWRERNKCAGKGTCVVEGKEQVWRERNKCGGKGTCVGEERKMVG